MRNKYPGNRRKSAFSLVEVVLAMGVVSFSCVTLLGLLGNGLLTVNRAVGTTVQAQIIQTVINNSHVRSYDSTYATNFYFSDQGVLVPKTDPTQVYGAKISILPLKVGTSTLDKVTSGSTLQIAITNRTLPGVTNSFSLVWCNSGN